MPANSNPQYHRLANPRTQTQKDAKMQNRTKEMWGRGNFGSMLPSVAAWLGPLAETREGTEFSTAIPYARNGDPAWAIWYLPEHGGHPDVNKREVGAHTYASVKIEPIKNRYRCKP